jgi:hypothetical protein
MGNKKSLPNSKERVENSNKDENYINEKIIR